MNNNNYTKIENELANISHLENLKSGRHTIRDERGWRVNEIEIEYIWLVIFDRSFHGKGGILNIKYKENKFRKFNNIEKLVKSIFCINKGWNIESFYEEEEHSDFMNLIPLFNNVSLFESNKGITLDGIGYYIRLFSMNTDVTIDVNNPRHETWQILENEFWEIGQLMANNSKDEKLMSLFE